jgi:hypothetical protein
VVIFGASPCAVKPIPEKKPGPHRAGATTPKLEARAVGYLRRAIENDQGELISLLASDRDLDPLRRRADFRDLLADANLPRHPFATAPGPGWWGRNGARVPEKTIRLPWFEIHLPKFLRSLR